MQTGAWVSPFITQLTGITNEMLRTAPPAAEVMREAARFVGDAPMVAHNASFDSKFWQAELALAGRPHPMRLPARCCCRAASIRRHPAIAWAIWRAICSCLPRAARTGHWPMPKWRQLCWHACSRICARVMPCPGEHALLMQLQRCSKARTGSWLAQQAAQVSLAAG